MIIMALSSEGFKFTGIRHMRDPGNTIMPPMPPGCMGRMHPQAFTATIRDIHSHTGLQQLAAFEAGLPAF